MSGKILPVRVAVRIRPISSKEVQEGCTQCLHVTEGEPQVVLSGTEKAFTYDFVFDTSRSQQELYDTAVKNMLDSLFQGYNVTILAYGQTGSGKTYTMGTAYSQDEGMTAETGVIPRAMSDLFRCIAERTADTELLVKVSFLEIYKEQLFDLLSDGARADTAVEIREDAKGIKVAGLTEITVTTVTETMACLERGGQSRVTGATAMNMRSSRSHAIFTVTLEQRALDSGQIITAKLHLVDLAGSERAKKTQATGTRFQEGVNINRGLLSLGNVISALGENKPAKHVPYRDSKLTRMLQESLGGNSHTLMIACTSPADSNLEETVSTLRYADRARKIKNKPVVNREGGEAARLRQQVRQLQEQLMNGGGRPAVSSRELELLRLENARLMTNLQAAIEESAVQSEKVILAERAHDQLKQQLEELYQHTGEGMTRAADAGGADVALLQELQVRVLQLQSDQTTHEEELRRLDVTRHAAAACPGGAAAAAADGSAESDQDEEQQLLKKHELRQMELNKELLHLNRDLALKESLAVEVESNSAQLARVRERYERAQRELEAQVSQLTEEKRRLETALQGARTDASGTAESSQKRQRVLQLEQRIKELHYKMKEQERLARMKRAADEKVVKLNGDIQSIKQARVRLLRQMREDADKFRQWRQQKDREVQQLRAQDRKRQVQLVKLERQHTKQETVLRRKMEHAVAANRRLKEALDVQRSARDRRQGAASGGAAAALAQLDQELELQVSTRLAQRSLDNLLEDRRRITQQISDMEGELERDLPAEEMAQVTRTIRDLQSDLQSRSAQITDLQHRLVETDGRVAPSAAPQRWPALTSMTDTKQAMAHLFEQVVSSRSDAGAREADSAELQTQLEEALKQLEEQESQQRELRRQQERELSRLTLDYEEKVLLLLRHMPPPPRCSTPEPGSRQETEDGAAALQRRLELQQAEIQRLSELHDQLTERNAEVERLRQQLAERQAAPMPPRPRPAKPRKVAATLEVDMMVSSDESDVDDVARDPNWQRTPLFKRISKITARASKLARSGAPHLAPPTLDSDSENQDPAEAGGDTASGSGTKRNSDGAARCKCVGKCIRCPCRASGQACEASCGCRAAHCRNRGPAAAADAADETFTLGAADATFLVPEKKANKKARRLTLVPNDGSDLPDAGQRTKPLSKFDEE